MRKQIFLLLMAFTIIFSMSASAFAAPEHNNNSLELKIQALYDKRAELVNEENIDLIKIKRIENQLQALGVEFLTPAQVNSRFQQQDITPLIDVPSQDNVSWSTYRVQSLNLVENYMMFNG